MSGVINFFNRYKKAISIGLPIYCAIMVAIIIINSLSFSDVYRAKPSAEVSFSEGWEVFEDDKLVRENYTLPYTPSSRNVETIVLRGTVPKTDLALNAVVIHLFQTVLTAEVDGKLVYQSPYDPNFMNKTSGSTRVVIPLPDNSVGKEIVLRYTRVVKGDLTGVTGMYITDPVNGGAFKLTQNNWLFFGMTTMLALGIIGIVVIAFDGVQMIKHPLLYIALFAIVTPIWLLCNSKLMLFFTDNLVLIHNLEYICFFLFPLPIWAFLWTNWHHFPRATSLVIRSLSVFFAIAVTLKVLGIADFYALTSIYHILLLVVVPLFALSAVYGLRYGDTSLRLFFAGFVLLALSGGIDLIRFNFFSSASTDFFSRGMVCMGICVVASYLISAKTHIETQAEDNIYKVLAYTDKLTGLHNRLTFEDDVVAISSDMGKYHSIIFVNIDVNRFKQINDSYGHVMGDRVLQLIARLLRETFDSIGKCYRMGGDEFCIIALDQDPVHLEALLGRVNGELDRALIEFPISIAYGTAEYNHFLHRDLMDVFKAADDMMYTNKRRRRGDRDSFVERRTQPLQ